MAQDRQEVKLLLTFDPISEGREEYFHYVLGEFIPTLEHLGLKLCEAWHTAYGPYPLRLTGFLARDRATMEEILTSEDFQELEARLQDYVHNYTRRVVPVRRNFQF
ncbi:MAG: hypothetical protein GTO18_15430 [Anaerolineales bacterium]|nr:hypothetical protein [Anaerolineales bacterium]